MEEKDEVLDIIIDFVKVAKTKDVTMRASKSDSALHGCKYLLGQILRQWEIPNERLLISEAAIDLWKKLSSQNINDYTYVKLVKCENEQPIQVDLYTGSSSVGKEEWLKKGDKFKFNSVFHEDHIVPINVIIKELFSLESLNYQNVKKVLNKIAICRILKNEDRMLNKNHSRSNRPSSINEVLEKDYRAVGITIAKNA